MDEIWCAVNDAFVMGAWGRELNAAGKVHAADDSSVATSPRPRVWCADPSAKGLARAPVASSMLVKDGVVTQLNDEQGGGYAVSDAATLLKQVQG